MNILLLLLLSFQLSGDIRARVSLSFPDPRGIRENYWTGSEPESYQRLRLAAGAWRVVVLTEKDTGEDWGDLLTGGIGYSSDCLEAAAGALRIQFAHGLLLGNSGSWSSTDPLSLSKAATWRLRTETAESPGLSDAGALTGVSAQYSSGGVSLACLGSISRIDPGESGLHRSPSEVASKGSVKVDLAAFRAGVGPLGLSYIALSREEGSACLNYGRFGADVFLHSGSSVLTAEVVTDMDTLCNFLVSASRGSSDFRHGISIGRGEGDLPFTALPFGTDTRLGAGYGTRWKPAGRVTIDAGILYLQGNEDDRIGTAFQFSESLEGRTELTQRLSYSSSDGESTLSGRVTAGWSPLSELTLSLKVPFSFYSSGENGDQSGAGLEARIRHRVSELFEYGLSAAGCSTGGWESRVYAYSLSFPGEFGSRALYDNSVLLQASATYNLSASAVLRSKCSWYCMEGSESLGSGWEETEGSSRTELGLQLDWEFR